MQQVEWSFDTIAQNEALINEIKGALFEYQVGEALKDVLSSGQAGLPIKKWDDPDTFTQLMRYEEWLRENDIPLLLFIPKAAKLTALRLADKINIDKEKDKDKVKKLQFKAISVVGKSASGSGQMDLFESDLVVEASALEGLQEVKKYFFIGLKWAKSHSYINTKSGGIKSLFLNYFGAFSKATQLQNELNHHLEISFNKMGQKLYEEAMPDREFSGTFDEYWTASYSELPGQLPEHLNLIVQKFYQDLIEIIYKNMNFLYLEDRELFKHCLFSLLGLGASNLIQTIVYVDTKKNPQKEYSLNSIAIHDYADLKEQLSEARLGELKPSIASFEILLKSWKLQIRIKPMNKFTTPSVKINCSVKFEL